MAIILIVIKASLLLGAALLGARTLRAMPAGTRHALWSATFAALLVLPVLDGAVPALQVPVPDAWAAPLSEMPGLTARPAGVPSAAGPAVTNEPTEPLPAATGQLSGSRREHASATPSQSPAFEWPSIAALAWTVWLGGALMASGALVLSLLRVRRLTRTAADVADTGWRDAAAAIGARLAIKRPARVLVSDAVRTPMAGGVWQPVIFLPAPAASWPAEQRDVVLAHELAHIARRDPLRHVATRLAMACYWFHPLAWVAARQSALAREQACD